VSDFEEKLAELAKSRNCDGIICGHIHQPAIRDINGIVYMNSGDWVETMSALTEDYEGNWKLEFYNEKPVQQEIKKTKTKAKKEPELLTASL
jgi:UDP-2,3-diacylglucosamine pyrophosphatase LpxH